VSYLASELIDGQSLSAWTRASPPPLRDAVRMVGDVARAVAFAHQHSIIHRDIKPHNILMDAAGNARLTDFGVAKSGENDPTLTSTGSLVGTPAYMSPEQARAEAVTSASDQYSLGVVLFELLTGRCPFEGPTHVVIVKVATADAPAPRTLNPSIPFELDAICRKALSRHPDERYASTDAFADDLERFLVGEPVLATKLPMSLVVRRTLRSRRFWIAAGLMVAASLLGVASMNQRWLGLSLEMADHSPSPPMPPTPTDPATVGTPVPVLPVPLSAPEPTIADLPDAAPPPESPTKEKTSVDEPSVEAKPVWLTILPPSDLRLQSNRGLVLVRNLDDVAKERRRLFEDFFNRKLPVELIWFVGNEERAGQLGIEMPKRDRGDPANPALPKEQNPTSYVGHTWVEIVASFPHADQLRGMVRELNVGLSRVDLRYAFCQVERSQMDGDGQWTPWAPIPWKIQNSFLESAAELDDPFASLPNGVAVAGLVMRVPERLRIAGVDGPAIQTRPPLIPSPFLTAQPPKWTADDIRPNLGDPPPFPIDNFTDVDVALMRVFDFTVQPDQSYRYRVRAVLFRPDNTEPDKQLPDLGTGFLVSPWSDPAEVTVEPNVSFTLTRGQPPSRSKAKFETLTWLSPAGFGARAEVTASIGNMIDARTGRNSASISYDFPTGQPRIRRENFEVDTGHVLLDVLPAKFQGWVAGRECYVTSSVEVVLLDPTGRLVRMDESDEPFAEESHLDDLMARTKQQPSPVAMPDANAPRNAGRPVETLLNHRVTVAIDEQPIEEIAKEIMARTGAHIQVDRDSFARSQTPIDRPLSLTSQKERLGQLLVRLTQDNNMTLELRSNPSRIIIRARPSFEKLPDDAEPVEPTP
jgi:serine/threonine protein kinase